MEDITYQIHNGIGLTFFVVQEKHSNIDQIANGVDQLNRILGYRRQMHCCHCQDICWNLLMYTQDNNRWSFLNNKMSTIVKIHREYMQLESITSALPLALPRIFVTKSKRNRCSAPLQVCKMLLTWKIDLGAPYCWKKISRCFSKVKRGRRVYHRCQIQRVCGTVLLKITLGSWNVSFIANNKYRVVVPKYQESKTSIIIQISQGVHSVHYTIFDRHNTQLSCISIFISHNQRRWMLLKLSTGADNLVLPRIQMEYAIAIQVHI
jgi:hypothetical protein